VAQHPHVGGIPPFEEPPESLQNTLFRALGLRGDLDVEDFAGLLVHRDEVREGAPDIDAHPVHG
jgi:hypothetical protein